MTIAAVLLAGGESRRMGRDKATMMWNGKPLWQNQLEILRGLAPLQLLISGRTDFAWRPRQTIFVADAPPSRGPISGITAALRRMTATHLVVLAIDMPAMTTEYLKRLCSNLQTGVGIIPMFDDKPEPLAAVYPVGATPYFNAGLVGKDFSLRSVVCRLIGDGLVNGLRIDENDTALFQNLNEPASSAVSPGDA